MAEKDPSPAKAETDKIVVNMQPKQKPQGFGAPVATDSSSSSVSPARGNRAVEKQRYRDLLRTVKKADSLVKVVGSGVDAKLPKQHITGGSSRGR